jgi:predicted enzyme related to lactoylglutathione lyase
MLNLNSVLIGSGQPRVLVAFYAGMFGRAPDFENGGYAGWRVGGGFLTVGPHADAKGWAREPARLVLNFETDRVAEEFERVKGVGAVVVHAPYRIEAADGWIATLADPDGNCFQLVSRAVAQRAGGSAAAANVLARPAA